MGTNEIIKSLGLLRRVTDDAYSTIQAYLKAKNEGADREKVDDERREAKIYLRRLKQYLKETDFDEMGIE